MTIPLIPRWILGALDLTSYPFGVEFGSSLGNAENETAIIASLLADGEIEATPRRNNRTISLPITIDGTDLLVLADAEARLAAECGKQRNILKAVPGDGIAPATLFETFAAQVERVYSDEAEIGRMRRYVLTIRALPHGLSVDEVVDDAGTPPVSSGVLLDNCESATGWTRWDGTGAATVDATVFTEGAGSIRTQAISSEISTGSHYVYFYWLTYELWQVTGLELDTDAGGYLSMAVRIEYDDVLPDPAPKPGLDKLFMQVDGGEWEEVPDFVKVRFDENGFIHYAWPVDAGLNVTGLRAAVRQVRHDNTGNGTGGFEHNPYTWFDDVELLPAATTDHQIVKTHFVKGSARTPGSLRISSPSPLVALGKVLAITIAENEVPAGWQPDGGRWIVAGDAQTDDPSALNGVYYVPDPDDYLATGDEPVIEVPVKTLATGPGRAYMMVSLVDVEGDEVHAGVQAQLVIDGDPVGEPSAAEITRPGLDLGWNFVPVGVVYLPPRPVQSADDTVKVRLLFKGAKLANVYMIPVWNDDGGRTVADFTIIDCGTGTVGPAAASSSCWIESAAPGQLVGAYWRGPTPDKVNAVAAWADCEKRGTHIFPPGAMRNFVVSLGAAGPTSTLRSRPAWAFGMAAL